MTPNDNENGLHRPISPNSEEKKKEPSSNQDGLPKIGKTSDKGKNYFKYGIFGLVVVSLIISSFFSSKKTDNVKVDEKQQEQIRPNFDTVKTAQPAVMKPAAIVSQSKPSAQEINPELEKIKKAIDELKSEQNKLYELQLKAPIEVYSSDNSQTAINTNVSHDNEVSSSSSNTPSRLPLSQDQISALSRAGIGNDPNTAFMQQKGSEEQTPRAEAGHIPYFSETLIEGTPIHGLIDSAINSDLAGPIEGHITQTVYSPTGIPLIPKGAKFNGAYNSALVMGQERLCIMVSRITLPNGVFVMPGSPITDSLGRSGLEADHVETHFWQKFGGATLISIIGGLTATAGVDQDAGYNSLSEYRMMMSNNFQQSANAALLSNINIKNTLMKDQGGKVMIVLTRDLSFHDILHEGNS